MTATIILYSEEYKNSIKQICAMDIFSISSAIMLPRDTLPIDIPDNTVYSDINKQTINSFESTTDELVDKIKQKRISNIILALPNECLKHVCRSLRPIQNLHIYVLPYYLDNKETIVKDDLISIDISYPRLKMVQVNLSQHCNLNCKGCANYSSIVSQPSFSDMEQVISDFSQLKKFFWGIEKIKLMGGEPLLNTQLPLYLSKIRSLYPDAKIEIATNGTLISRQPDYLFDQMVENKVEFVISLYPATIHLKANIEALLSQKKVTYHIFEFGRHFMKYLYKEPVWDMQTAFLHCPAYGCHYLENGYLAVCARPLFVYRLNDRFDAGFPEEGGKWNIYTTDVDPWDLDSLLNHPFEFCKHCGPKEFFDWEVKKSDDACLEDWICY